MGKVLEDIRSIKERDPACKSCVEVALLYSGFHALLLYRISHGLYKGKMFFLARLVSQLGRWLTGIEIHPGATIGRGFFIDHGSGVVIGETAEIGDYCTIYQGVTLGGTGKETGKRHPTLGDGVMVGAGAKILGPVNIGSYAKIAAGAVVLGRVPDYGTAVGVPARVVRINSQKVKDTQHGGDLDQVNMPDPVSQELCRLSGMVERLQKRVDQLEHGESGPDNTVETA